MPHDGTPIGAQLSDPAGIPHEHGARRPARAPRHDGRASLGAGTTELLVLVEEPGARQATGFTGLYHFALLLARRADLARWLTHAAHDRVPLVGLSDHLVSEALYLSDPDGHGIEIYWDRPRAVWEGQVATRMTTLPLDVENRLSELDDPGAERYAGLPADTVMGHVHLKVAAVPETALVWLYHAVCNECAPLCAPVSRAARGARRCSRGRGTR